LAKLVVPPIAGTRQLKNRLCEGSRRVDSRRREKRHKTKTPNENKKGKGRPRVSVGDALKKDKSKKNTKAATQKV